MKESVEEILHNHYRKIILAISATLFDSASTILALSKPGTTELNPLVNATMMGETFLTQTLSISAIPLTAVVIGIILWARAKIPRMYEVFYEALITVQTVAGINNTLIYIGHPTPWTLILLIAMIGSYATRFYIIWKQSEVQRKLMSRFPSQPI